MYSSEEHPTEDYESREDHPYTSRSHDERPRKRAGGPHRYGAKRRLRRKSADNVPVKR